MTDTNEKAVAIIEKKLAPILVTAQNIRITNAKEMEEAAVQLTHLNRYGDELKKLKETMTKPMNAALKAARELFRPREVRIDEAVTSIRNKMSTYQTEQEVLAKAEEDKIAARVGQGKGKLKPETAVRQMDELDRPAKSIDTGIGSIKFRTDQKLKITNAQSVVTWLIKNACWDAVEISERAVYTLLKEGKKIPGAELEEVRTVVSKR